MTRGRSVQQETWREGDGGWVLLLDFFAGDHPPELSVLFDKNTMVLPNGVCWNLVLSASIPNQLFICLLSAFAASNKMLHYALPVRNTPSVTVACYCTSIFLQLRSHAVSCTCLQDKRLCYYNDTFKGTVNAIPCEAKSGLPDTAAAWQTVVKLDAEVEGSPDGIAIDCNGNLWVAHESGSQASSSTLINTNRMLMSS